MEYMEYEDGDIIKPLDRLFEDHRKEFESGGDSHSNRELKKKILELGGFEMGCRTGSRRNPE